MARDLSPLCILRTTEELLACLRDDTNDRILVWTDDLSSGEWDESGCAIRTDISILVVCSLQALSASTIDEFVDACQRRQPHYQDGCHPEEIAIVVSDEKDKFGQRMIPADIQLLLDAAEELKPGRILSEAGYEGLWALTGSKM